MELEGGEVANDIFFKFGTHGANLNLNSTVHILRTI